MNVPQIPAGLLSRSAKEIAGWVLTAAEYACIDYHIAERSGKSAIDAATETSMLLQMVLSTIGMRPADLPMNFLSPIWDLMTIRGHIRNAFNWNGGPQHREDFSYGQ